MSKKFRTPPEVSAGTWDFIESQVPEDHLARFIDEVVDYLDISSITDHYERSMEGYPPYNPTMMLKVWLLS